MTSHPHEIIPISFLCHPHEIIPISFYMYEVLHKKYYNIQNYLMQTGSQARSSGIKLQEVHGMGKNLDTNINQKNNMPIPYKAVYRSHA